MLYDDRQMTSRRTILGAATMGGMMMMAGPAIGAGADPVVETRHGRVRGTRIANCFVFRGIRYATAERFQPPVPPPNWGGVQDAIAPGASAPQTNANPPPGPPYVILAQMPRAAGATPPPRLPESEDCLFLNIWTPEIGNGRKRPVLLALHGGFFYGGTGSTLDGSGLAGRGDAIVVSINHRLNAFGYTHLADMAGDDFAHSGNAGMMDIVAALQWVQDNIEAFGGDPKRVMVLGSSGGGMKTSFLMASKPAKGLFSRAGVQSGPGLKFMERDAASVVTDRLLRELGIARANVRDLATIPADRLLAGYHAVATTLPASRFIDLPCFAPVIDPVWLPRHPFSPDAARMTADVPMLIGSNGQEMSFFWGNDPGAFTVDDAELTRRVALFAGEQTPSILETYRQSYPQATAPRLYLQIMSDYSVTLPVMAQADRHAAAGGRTFAYRLDWQSPALGGKLGALHTLEASLIFNTPESSRALLGPGPGPSRLAQIMSDAWVRFAATGDPSVAGGLAWPRYTSGTRSMLVFNDGARRMDDPNALARNAMASMLRA